MLTDLNNGGDRLSRADLAEWAASEAGQKVPSPPPPHTRIICCETPRVGDCVQGSVPRGGRERETHAPESGSDAWQGDISGELSGVLRLLQNVFGSVSGVSFFHGVPGWSDSAAGQPAAAIRDEHGRALGGGGEGGPYLPVE